MNPLLAQGIEQFIAEKWQELGLAGVSIIGIFLVARAYDRRTSKELEQVYGQLAAVAGSREKAMENAIALAREVGKLQERVAGVEDLVRELKTSISELARAVNDLARERSPRT